MNLKDIKHHLEKSEQYLIRGRLKNAIKLQRDLATELNIGFLLDKIEAQQQSYNYLLEFFRKGVEDPKRKELFDDIRRNLFAVNDLTWREVVKDYPPYAHYFNSYSFPNLELDPKKIIEKKQQIQPDVQIKYDIFDEQILEEFFVNIWLSPDLTDDDYKRFKSFLASEAHWVHKALAVSALTLSLLYYFCPRKMMLLFDAILLKEYQVWERAIVGLVIILSIYDQRIKFYPDLASRIKTLPEIDNFKNVFRTVVIQLLRSAVETQILQEKFEKEILPDIERLSPKFGSFSEISDLLSDEASEEENPDWSKFIPQDQEFIEKLSELSRLQMEGADTFHSAFSKMKNFPFFSKINNWFLPFYPDNQAIIDLFTDEQISSDKAREFVNNLSQTSYICNSDKYSFSFQISFFMRFQGQSILDLFSEQAKMDEEVSETESLSDPLSKSRVVIIQYVQDLYRFFELYPQRGQIPNVFGDNLLFHKRQFFRWLSDQSLVIEIGDFYLGQKLYSQSLEVYLNTENYENNPELLEKIGFCYQKIKQYDKALEFYKKAEIFDQNKKWLVKKLGYCSMKVGNYDQALYYYNKLLDQDPENHKVLLNIAKCYLNKGDYRQALQYYHQVNFYNPDNPKILSIIARLNLHLGDIDKARKYCDQLLNSQPDAGDFIFAGHIYLLSADRKKAFDLYKQGYNQLADLEKFEKLFYEDRDILRSMGLSDFEIDLVFEAVVE